MPEALADGGPPVLLIPKPVKHDFTSELAAPGSAGAGGPRCRQLTSEIVFHGFWDQEDGRAAVREGLWHARRLPPFVAERPNPLSYLRRLRLRCRGCGRLEQASYEFRCAAGPRPPARDSSRVLKEG